MNDLPIAETREQEIRELDAKARLVAQTMFDRPVVVEAGAGTGKTSALVARIVTWCLGPGWRKGCASLEGRVCTPEAIALRVLQGVTAMTFTEAAASEMAQRAGKAFAALEKGGSLPPGIDEEALDAAMFEEGARDLLELRRERARCLLLAIDRLRAYTIHSFCKRLLDEHPLEAGWHPAFQIDGQGLEIARVVREVVEDQLQQAIRRGDSAFLRLVDRGIDPQDIEKSLLEFVKQQIPATLFREDPLSHLRVYRAAQDLSRVLEKIGQIVEPAFSGVARAPKAKQIAELIKVSQEQIRPFTQPPTASGDSVSAEALEEACVWLSDHWEGVGNKLKEWTTGKFAKSELMALEEKTDALTEASAELRIYLNDWTSFNPRALPDLCEVMADGLEVCHERLRAQGIASFESLIRGARDLLVNSDAVAERIRGGIDQLLVDEFQDTNPVQCDLIRAIAMTGPMDRRPGLFLVGDPKQSIYSWRQADLAAYDQFIEELSDEEDPRVQLTVNFRSSQEVLEEVAAVIRPVMIEEHGLQPGFAHLLPQAHSPKDKHKPGTGKVEHWVSWQWDPDTSAPSQKLRTSELDLIEARALANQMNRLRAEEGIPWCEMGVLTRANQQGDVIAQALRAAGIPYVIEQDRTFFQRREIVDAAALVRVVLDPSDNLALLTWLRSSFMGVPDAALIPLWKEAFPEKVSELLLMESMESASLKESGGEHSLALSEALAAVERAVLGMPEDVPGIERVQGWEKGLRFGLIALAKLRRSFLTEPFDDFVEQLPKSFLMEATEGARYPGAYRVANLERFFRELLELYVKLDGDISQLLRQLRSDLSGGRQAEATRPRSGEKNSVSVMTIHKSKGLEFEAVFLPGLHKESKRVGDVRSGAEQIPVTAVGESGEQALQWEWRLFGVSTLGFGEVLRREQEKSSAERVRLLYVAMTRAKKHLVLSGKWKAAPPPMIPSRARSFLDLISARDGSVPDLNAMMSHLQESAEIQQEQAGVRWCFPDLSPELKKEPDAALITSSALCVEKELEAARAAEELRQQQRALACKRMSRSFAGSPSVISHAETETHGKKQKGSDVHVKSYGDSWAAAVGIAIHAALEAFDFKIDPQEAWTQQGDALASRLASALPAALCADALEAGNSLWEGFRSGPLFQSFIDAGKSECVRELDVLIRVDPGEENGPVGVYTGSIDLLYRDASGEVVVVDYKTDAVREPKQVQERAAAYLEQGRLYQRAVREALRLEKDPRFELWFLRPGIVWSQDSGL